MRLPVLLLLVSWASLSHQESADLTPFHGFLPQSKLRALLPPGDPHPNDIYRRSQPQPEPIPPGFEIKYPDYKFTFDIPKDPERPVYIITEKSTEPVIHGHHACDGHGRGTIGAISMPPTAATPIRPTVKPPVRPLVARPTARPTVKTAGRSVRPSIRPTVRPKLRPAVRPSRRPVVRAVRPFSGGGRRPVQLTSSATLSRPAPTVLTKPRLPRPPPPSLLTKSRQTLLPRPTARPARTKPTPTPSAFTRMKNKLRKYPADQYRLFPGGYARLSTYSSLSG